jgi:hypothetical protein
MANLSGNKKFYCWIKESRLNDEELIEMKLIQSKKEIENPSLLVNAELIPRNARK